MMKIIVSCLCVLSLIIVGSGVSAETGSLHVQIGIKVISDDGDFEAKKVTNVTRGDTIRIYVVPRFEKAYVYVVQLVNDRATRLEDRRPYPIASRYLLTFPVPSERDLLYPEPTPPQEAPVHEIKNARETFIIVCSPKPLSELEDLFRGGSVSKKQWTELERKYQGSELALGVSFGKPLNMAGTARSDGDKFPEQLTAYSGDALVMTQYTFRAKK